MILQKEKLKKAVVGIAGLGGLGSTVAHALARTNIGRLVIADFDMIEQDNLNRQQYFTEQIGTAKVDATLENLKRINPDIEIQPYKIKLTPENIPEIFADTHVIVECFDRADQKQMIVETVLNKMPNTVIVAASGLAGFGNSNTILTKRLSKRLILVGDDQSDVEVVGSLTAGRVWIAAAHQANAVVEVLINEILS
jgi:sulfur carrier protein ThiS adenylyltransferase